MTKVTNNSSAVLAVQVRGKKGEIKHEDLRPGETADLDLADRNSPLNLGREAAGALTFGDKAGKERAPESAAPPGI